jgi:hypothetical protein
MKKYVLLTMALVIGVSSFGQTLLSGDRIQLDSIVKNGEGTDTFHEKYQYDFYGRLVYRYNFSYNNNVLHETECTREYSDRHIVQITKQSASDSKALLNDEKREMFLNDAGALVEEQQYKWNTVSEEWEQLERSVYTYNNAGLRISGSVYRVVDESGQMKLYRTDTIEYNEMNMPVTILVKQLSGSQLVNFSKSTLIYDADTLLLTRLTYNWVASAESWVISKRFEYAYETLTKTITEENWVYEIGAFVNYHKAVYHYNDQGDVAYYENFGWNEETEAWEGISKNEFALEYDIAPELIIRPDAGFSPYTTLYEVPDPKGKVAEAVYYETDNGNWEVKTTTDYYYSAFKPQSVTGKNMLQLVVYPNPATDYIVVKDIQDYDRFAIYTSQGRLVNSGDVGSNPINISRIPAGVYLLKLSEKNRPVSTGVFVKQ